MLCKLVDEDSNEITATNPLDVTSSISGATIMLPVDMQGHQLTDAEALPVKIPSSTVYRAFAITANNDNDLANDTTGIYIATAGHLCVMLTGDVAAVTFSNLPVGFYPICASRVYATGTTATGIVGIY